MVQTSSSKDDWETPLYLYTQLDNIFKFEVDVACTTKNVKARYGFFHDLGNDGLAESWDGRAWCNPPFSEKEKWIKKAFVEVTSGRCPVCVMILPLNCISRKDFHTYVENKFFYQILEGRVWFLDGGVPSKSNNTGTIVIYFMNKPRLVSGGL